MRRNFNVPTSPAVTCVRLQRACGKHYELALNMFRAESRDQRWLEATRSSLVDTHDSTTGEVRQRIGFARSDDVHLIVETFNLLGDRSYLCQISTNDKNGALPH
jgi:hypothetical protein